MTLKYAMDLIYGGSYVMGIIENGFNIIGLMAPM
jgi:hypothetical protein